MRIFLTGGTGFIGSHFLKLALEAGHEVVALRRPGSVPRMPLNHEPQWIEGQLNDDWRAELQTCDTLIHLAANGVIASAHNRNDCFEVNVNSSSNLWKQAIAAGVRAMVVCGSCFEYGKAGEQYEFIPANAPLVPTGPYHASKAAASMMACALAVEHRLALEIVRPFHVFGLGEHHDRFWPALREAAMAGRDFQMTKGLQVRDFIEVEEVAREILLSTTSQTEVGIIIRNLGSGNPRSLIDFAREWWRRFGATGELIPGAIPDRSNEVMRYAACLKPVRY